MAVQTITYEDKQYLNQNADIPATNKVQDTDMNEIKEVVNNNAAETSSNTTNISNITGQILWTNPNPSSAISSDTTITLSSDDYDILKVFYKQSLNNNAMYTQEWVKTFNTRIGIESTDGVAYRTLTRVSDTNITISKTFTTSAYPESTTANWCIPIYIIGYKTGLFS